MIGRATVVAAVVASGVVLGRPATARACSCEVPAQWRHRLHPERAALPGDGAFLVVTRLLEDPVVRLLDPATGLHVTIDTESWLVVPAFVERWTLVRPRPTFARQTELDVYVDDELVSRVTLGGPVPSSSAPDHPGLSNLALEAFERIGDDCPAFYCWTHERMTRMRLVFDPPAGDVLFFVLQMRREGEDDPFYELPLLGDTLKLESRICEPDVPALTPDDTYCGRLVVYGRDGVAVNSTPEYCRAVALCPATPPACEAGQYCEPLDIGPGGAAADAAPESGPLIRDDGGCRAASNNAGGAQLVGLLGVLLLMRLVRSSTGTHRTGGAWTCRTRRARSGSVSWSTRDCRRRSSTRHI